MVVWVEQVAGRAWAPALRSQRNAASSLSMEFDYDVIIVGCGVGGEHCAPSLDLWHPVRAPLWQARMRVRLLLQLLLLLPTGPYQSHALCARMQRACLLPVRPCGHTLSRTSTMRCCGSRDFT